MKATPLQLEESNLMSYITSKCRLDAAFSWLFKKKQKAGSNDLFWGMTQNWQHIKATLRAQLQRGDYSFSPLKTVQLQDGMLVSIWHPEDSIVIKALTEVIAPLFKVNMDLTAATHLKGNGGLKQAVQKVRAKLSENNFAYKTDIADYYASIKHDVLLEKLRSKIKDNRVMKLLQQILNRVHVRNGAHRLIENTSIPRSCSLSPLLAAIYLQPQGEWARKEKIDYVRYMDDIVILTKKRYQLRRAIKKVYSITEELGLKLATTKTWLGRVSKGFTFLGYQISPNGIQVAQGSLSRMMTKLHRLYEQGATKKRLVDYVKRWITWAKAGVSLIDAPLKLNIKINPSKQRGYSFKLHNNEWSCCL